MHIHANNFLLSIRSAPFRRSEPTPLKPTLKGAPSYNALTGLEQERPQLVDQDRETLAGMSVTEIPSPLAREGSHFIAIVTTFECDPSAVWMTNCTASPVGALAGTCTFI
jgi:hypothetical protein